MYKLSFKMDGVQKMMNRLVGLREVLPEINNRSIESVLILGFDVAYNLCPVLSGDLQKTISYDVTGMNEGTLSAGGSTAPYAKFVNFGTSKMEPRPFFTIAFHEMKRQFPEIAIQVMEAPIKTQTKPRVVRTASSVGTRRLGGSTKLEKAEKRFMTHKYESVYISQKTGKKKYKYRRANYGVTHYRGVKQNRSGRTRGQFA